MEAVIVLDMKIVVDNTEFVSTFGTRDIKRLSERVVVPPRVRARIQSAEILGESRKTAIGIHAAALEQVAEDFANPIDVHSEFEIVQTSQEGKVIHKL